MRLAPWRGMGEALHPFATLSGILDRVLHVHLTRLRRLAASAADCADPRRAALLTFLREREAEHVLSLARYRRQDQEVLETWVQGVPAAAMATVTEDDAVPADVDGIIDDFRQRTAALRLLYEQLEATVGLPRARELLADLASREQVVQRRLQHALLDF